MWKKVLIPFCLAVERNFPFFVYDFFMQFCKDFLIGKFLLKDFCAGVILFVSVVTLGIVFIRFFSAKIIPQ